MPANTETVTRGTNVTDHITIDDNDDRPERMARDPDRYFADARQRAVHELMRQAAWLFPSLQRQKA